MGGEGEGERKGGRDGERKGGREGERERGRKEGIRREGEREREGGEGARKTFLQWTRQSTVKYSKILVYIY